MKWRGIAWSLSLFVSPSLVAQQATVTGKVVNAESQAPIARARIRIDGATLVTAADGSYRLTATPAAHEVVVTAFGFGVARRTVTVRAGEAAVEDFALSPHPVPLSQVVTIGTRSNVRTSTETSVPVDVITAAAMEETGFVEPWQALQRLVPSVNAPHAPLGDNHLRPLTLRGLSPNQVLILVNGKRRHTSAIGPTTPAATGTAATDVGTIPGSAIERIEVLRDGAAARYGSDAIAGVINIVLKSTDARETAVSWGQVYSVEGGRSFRDGDLTNLKSTYGIRWKDEGHVVISAEYRDRGPTNRAYPDARDQYFDGDPRNDGPKVISSHEGNGAVRDFSALVNAAFPFTTGHQAYAVLDARNRNGEAESAFFRRARDDRTVRALHPDGFLSWIEHSVADYSGLLGVRGIAKAWQWDVSSGYGRNSVRSDVHNSNNVTLGTESPTDFYAGTQAVNQWTANVDVSRLMRLRGLEIDVATGAEFRRNGYRVRQGEPDSYRDGGIRILDGPSAGRLGSVGSQGMLGFQPIDEVDVHRSNAAAYLELEGSASRTFLLSLVGRLEKYSGEATATHGKIAARYAPLRGLAIRGGMANGFRAPSLSQAYSSGTRTILRLVNGVSMPFVVRTLPVTSEPARLLGAKPLRPETSTHLSAGVVLERPGLPTVTADFFALRIEGRILQTSEFLGPQVEQIFVNAGLRGIAGGQYFANVVDTKTRGIDVVANHASRIPGGLWRLTAGLNVVRSRVARIAPAPEGFAGYDSLIFNRAQRGTLEVGQPRRTIVLTNHFASGRIALNLHNQRFGQAALLDIRDPARDQIVSAKWLTDLGLSYRLGPHMSISANAANLFDVYPDEWNDFKLGVNATGMSNAGIFRYPGGISPFGMNGRTVYFHVSWR